MISFRRPIIPFQGEDAMRFRDEALVLVRQGVLIERLSENFFAVVLSSEDQPAPSLLLPRHMRGLK